MKRKLFALAVMLVAALGIVGCAAQQAPSSSGGESKPSAESNSAVQSEIPSKSILLFDGNVKSKKLVADMKAGLTPTECTVLYDQMGALPSVTVNDEETIEKIYRLLANVTVIDESQNSLTDNYHSVSFTLKDGTKVGFTFEGEGLLTRGKKNYAISGSGPLWACVRTLQAGVTGGKNVYAINIQDDAGVVLDCPLTAEESETVRLVCSTEGYEKIHVFVNGEELTRSTDMFRTTGSSETMTPLPQKKYEFSMPASDVELKVTVESPTP